MRRRPACTARRPRVRGPAGRPPRGAPRGRPRTRGWRSPRARPAARTVPSPGTGRGRARARPPGAGSPSSPSGPCPRPPLAGQILPAGAAHCHRHHVTAGSVKRQTWSCAEDRDRCRPDHARCAGGKDPHPRSLHPPGLRQDVRRHRPDGATPRWTRARHHDRTRPLAPGGEGGRFGRKGGDAARQASTRGCPAPGRPGGPRTGADARMTTRARPSSGAAAKASGAGARSGATRTRGARVASYTAAAEILAGRDPVIARLFDEVGPPRVRRPLDSHFGALVRAIVYQQLAGASASAIHGRLLAAVEGEPEPARILALSDEAMRAAGLSGNKTASLRDLATKVLDGTVVLDPRGLAREGDEEVVARLSSVRGIGKWTAEMFLMFQLRRLDVWPTGDLGVRRGYGLAWKIPMPSAKELDPLGDPYRPYRSVAAWYCWRAVELYGRAAESVLTG